MTDPVAANLEAYQRGVDAYLSDRVPRPSEAHLRYLDTVAEMLPAGSTMLELGSGPGYDALHFEGRGVVVERTDGTPAFVDLLREQGHPTRLLEITTGALGGPWDAVFANAVLLHLTRAQLAAVLARIRIALKPDGLLAFTVKEGDDEGWSTAKIGVPRFFTYWREAALRTLLVDAGFTVLVMEHAQGRSEAWLYVCCRGNLPQPSGSPT